MKLRTPKILLIDDDTGFAEAMKRWLAQIGCELTHGASASRGVELIEQGSFDVLLLDLHLPDANGHAILRQLNAAGGALPVIVTSGTAEADDVLRAWRANAVDFLRKPFRLEDLEAAIDKAMATSANAAATNATATNAAATHATPTSPAATTPDLEASPPRASTAIADRTVALSAPAATPTARPAATDAPRVRPTVAKLLGDLKSGAVRLPILDPAIARLPEFLSNATWTIDELTELIARDSNLAAGVLLAANTAAYARGKAVTSLTEACKRIGAMAIVAICFEITVKGQFSVSSEPYRTVLKKAWDNAILCSRLAPLIADALGREDRENFRIFALFHNVGELLAVMMASQLDSADTPATLDELARDVEASHQDLGHALASSWKLPPTVASLAGYHHRPATQPEPKTQLQTRSIVLAAWAIALRAGLTYFPGQDSVDPAPFLRSLGLTDKHLAPLYAALSTWLPKQ